MEGLYQTQRIKDLKDKMLSEPRYASIEQALIITKTYQENEDDPKIIQRAKSLKAALEKMEIRVEPEELISHSSTRNWIFPPFCVYFTAFESRLLKICIK